MMFSIGVLVPLSLGRLGKGWKHARHIKELAQLVPRIALSSHSGMHADIQILSQRVREGYVEYATVVRILGDTSNPGI